MLKRGSKIFQLDCGSRRESPKQGVLVLVAIKEQTRFAGTRLMKLRFFYLQRHAAVFFMLLDATLAETGTTELAVEFLSVLNRVPALAAFDSPVNELKHKSRRAPTLIQMRLSTAEPFKQRKTDYVECFCFFTPAFALQ